MPEGDTIYITAAALRPVLVGRRIERARARHPAIDPRLLEGREVRSIETRGKHLLVHLDRGGTLHAHFGMHSTWHVYARGERWRKAGSRAGLVLDTEGHEVVCFDAHKLALLRTGALSRYPPLATLGPDVLSEGFDPAALAGWDARADLSLAEALLDQRLAAGIGNVYKSEVLFIRRLDPFSSLGALAEDARLALWGAASALMKANLRRGPRVTRRTLSRAKSQRLWVYRRARQPCHVCGTLVRKVDHGRQQRSTYFCAACQGVT